MQETLSRRKLFIFIYLHYLLHFTTNLFIYCIYSRVWLAPQTLFGTHSNQPPSGDHGFKDFLCSAHLVEAFDGQIYSLKHFHKSKFVHQRPQQDEHFRENPWNYELLRARGVYCTKKCLRGKSHSNRQATGMMVTRCRCCDWWLIVVLCSPLLTFLRHAADPDTDYLPHQNITHTPCTQHPVPNSLYQHL